MFTLQSLNNIVYFFANPVIGFITLAGLVKIWIDKKKIPEVKYIRIAIIINVIFILLRSLYATIVNYWMWSQSPATQEFLKLDYVVKFSFNNYWFTPIITLLFSFLIFKLLVFANKKFNERFFYNEEPYLIVLGIILNPWPMLFFFIISSIICLLVLQIFNLVKQKLYFKNSKIMFERVPFVNIWIPAMVISSSIYFVIFTNIFPFLRNILLSNWFIAQLFNNFSIF